MARTSKSHPLQIAAIEVGDRCGKIGVTLCPGKWQEDALTGSWERDLAADLDAIEAWGAAAVLTLIEDHELVALKVEALGEEVAARHMSWFHLPIPDFGVPSEKFERDWIEVGHSLRSILRSGFNILIHCKGGLGRTGTIAARLMVEMGHTPERAIAAVRRQRPGAIETRAQRQHVFAGRSVGEPHRDSSPDAVEDRALGCLLGLVVGDALGTTLEFTVRDSRPRLTDMVGGGVFGLEPGEWTDDTSMALALADSLLANEQLDPTDLMTRFVNWWQKGDYSCRGLCFDIGNTTSDALLRFKETGNPLAGSTHPQTAGNGSLMRLAPVVIHGFAQSECGAVDTAVLQSRTTHAAPACLESCSGFAFRLYLAATGKDRSFVFDLIADEATDPSVAAIFKGSYRGKRRNEIHSSGYVAHSLEAALWCVARTTTFKDAVLLAANLGDDADTTAAVTGQLAGALYGRSAIPAGWLERLAWKDRITDVAWHLYHRPGSGARLHDLS